jgi:hypothetical protein
MDIIETTQSVKSSPDWTISRALSELLANAIDASNELSEEEIPNVKLTYTKNIHMGKCFHHSSLPNSFVFEIQDYGRGIQKRNLISQGESSKRNTSSQKEYLGYHGKGMMEAFSVLLRNNFSITIKSEYVNVELFKDSENGNIVYHFQIEEEKGIVSKLFSQSETIKGTLITISLNEDFRKSIEEMEKNFIYFNISKGDLIEENDIGEIYLPREGKGGVFLHGYYLQVEFGIYENCYYVYNLRGSASCKSIDELIRNTDSGNNRKIISRNIAPCIRKIHDAITSPEIIKNSRKFILQNEYEFKDKIIQKKYASKKIIEDYELVEQKPLLEIIEKENIIKDVDVTSKKRKKCIVFLKGLDEDGITSLEDFLKENDFKYKFA